nr:hypothetical protein [Rhodoferax sp.]
MAFDERDTVHVLEGSAVALAAILSAYNGMQPGPVMEKHDFALRFLVSGNDSISPPHRLTFKFASIAIVEFKRHLHFKFFDRVACAGD